MRIISTNPATYASKESWDQFNKRRKRNIQKAIKANSYFDDIFKAVTQATDIIEGGLNGK